MNFRNWLKKKTKKKKLTEDELTEIMDKGREEGLLPIITFADPSTEEGKQMQDYINSHYLLPSNYPENNKEITKEKIKKMRQELLDKNTKIERKKKILMLLGHHGSFEALGSLENYAICPNQELKGWVKMAKNECKMFLQSNPEFK
ncbi:hypothetical protein KKG58_02220 [Patescibacteria group bacterium]|nr:hypothetical protein [Patescibacteria group bacterium]